MNVIVKTLIALAFGGGLACATLPFAADSMERPKITVMRALPQNQIQAATPGPMDITAQN